MIFRGVFLYKKIYIIGPVGSGKTTLSKFLSNRYGIEKYELDKVIFDDSNVRRTDEEVSILFNKIISGKSWIIEDVGRDKFIDVVRKANIIYYIFLPKIVVYKRCISRCFKQKIGIKKYNYKPTLKGLVQMLKWARQDLNNRNLKIQFIKNNSKKCKILKMKDVRKLVFE